MMKRFLILGLVFSTVALNAGEGKVETADKKEAAAPALDIDFVKAIAEAAKKGGEDLEKVLGDKDLSKLPEGLKKAIDALNDLPKDAANDKVEAAVKAVAAAADKELQPKTSIATRIANVVCYPSDKVFGALAKSRFAQATILYSSVAAVTYAVAGDQIKDALGFNDEVSDIEAA